MYICVAGGFCLVKEENNYISYEFCKICFLTLLKNKRTIPPKTSSTNLSDSLIDYLLDP